MPCDQEPRLCGAKRHKTWGRRSDRSESGQPVWRLHDVHVFVDKFGATSFLNSVSRSGLFASSTGPSLFSSLCSKGLVKANTTSLRIFHKVLMSALACNFQLRPFDRYVSKLLFCVDCSLQRKKPNGLSPPEVHQQ